MLAVIPGAPELAARGGADRYTGVLPRGLR
jgi:hypothetical protein